MSPGLHWNPSLWTLMPDVILRGGKWFRNLQNRCRSTHFQSNAISRAKYIPAFILLIRRKNNLHFFISEAVWNESRMEGSRWKGQKTEGRLETVGSWRTDEKHWANFIKVIHHKCARHAHTLTHWPTRNDMPRRATRWAAIISEANNSPFQFSPQTKQKPRAQRKHASYYHVSNSWVTTTLI